MFIVKMLRAGEMAPLVKRLLLKQEDPSLIPGSPVKTWVWWYERVF